MERKTSLYLGLSFLAGVLLTLGFKDVYPDLERRYRQRRRRFSVVDPRHRGSLSRLAGEKLQLKDNTAQREDEKNLPQDKEIPDGIESTIGNTPIFRIKSLSDATGCDIIAKAEFLNGAGGSPKDRVALGIIQMVSSPHAEQSARH